MALARSRPTTAVSPRAPWGWAAAGLLLGGAAALLFFAPARWAAAAVANATDGRVVLEAPRGTIWNGSAQLLFTGGAGSRDVTALPSRLGWRLAPAVGGLNLQLDADCCTPQPLALTLSPRWRGGAVSVADGTPSQWPAALLAGLGTPWNTLQIDGELQLSTRGLAIDWTQGRVRVAGAADVDALRISSSLSPLRPMGSYRLHLGGGAVPTLQLSTLDGSLQLSGNGQWVGSRLRFSGEARAAAERQAALDNLLNIIGRRDGARSLITIG